MHTGPFAATVGLKQARVMEGMAEVLPETLQLKIHPLALFPTELPLMGPTGPSVARVGLERARPVEGIAEVLARLSSIKTNL